jgi:hypothetical protein
VNGLRVPEEYINKKDSSKKELQFSIFMTVLKWCFVIQQACPELCRRESFLKAAHFVN